MSGNATFLLVKARGRTSSRSMYRNWRSARLDPKKYSKLTLVNWTKLYVAMYLKQLKDVTREARPSLITSITEKMSDDLLAVNGAATEASASEREIPMSAVVNAPTSLPIPLGHVKKY